MLYIKESQYAILVSCMMVLIIKRRIRYRLIIMGLIIFDFVYIIIEGLTYKFIETPCYMDTSVIQTHHTKLEDVLLSPEQPPAGRSIFFIDTRCNRSKQSLLDSFEPPVLNIANLSLRQACAIESAALHNPNFKVIVLFANPTYFDSEVSDNLINAILTYPNVRLRNLNVSTFMTGTPVYDWFQQHDIFKSAYMVEHVSDFLRLVALWRWGGLYLDMDTITLRTMEKLPHNYAGIEPGYLNLGNSVLNFSPTGFGHDIVTLCLKDFIQNFNGTEWSQNGPKVIMRTLTNVCGTNQTKLMMHNTKRCKGFHVFHPSAFYAVTWFHWRDFFLPDMLEDTMKTLEPSYVTHLWNHISKEWFNKFGNNAPLDILAKEHCPYVYNKSGKYF